ncbi:MAG: OmpA family protein [Pseudomonadota bacterium]
MPNLKLLLVLAISSVSLNACEMVRHFSEEDDVTVSNNQMVSSSSDMKLSPMPPQGTDPNAQGRFATAPGLQPIPQFPEPTDRDLMVITDKLAGGSVEIYTLDRPQGGAAMPRAPQGMRSVVEPNVTVFPLADNGPYPGQSAPQAIWPNAVLPSGSLTPMGMEAGSRDGYGTGDARVYFRHGSSSLDRDDKRVIKDVSERAKFSPVTRVSVEGHASRRAESSDPVRNQILNLKESMNRAVAVSKTMIMNGVPGEKIKTTAWGDTKPPATVQGNPEAEARRVEVFTGSGY